MKEVFYSEKLKKYFDTKEECIAAEEEYDSVNLKKEKEKAEKAAEAKKVEDAYKETMQARHKAADIILEANKMVDEADKKYYAARREFINKYGSFHMTYSNDNGQEEIMVSDLLENLFNLLKIE